MIFRVYIEEDSRLLVLEAKDGQVIKYHQKDVQDIVLKMWNCKERHFIGELNPKTKLVELKPLD